MSCFSDKCKQKLINNKKICFVNIFNSTETIQLFNNYKPLKQIVMETLFYFAMLTFFSWLVAGRAAKLNRNPWGWGIAAWFISPLFVWIVLEICGKRQEEVVINEVEDIEYAELQEAIPENS